MIQPDFLNTLRRRYRTELVLTLVQFEQACPGWWPDVSQIAEQFGTDRASLNSSITKLEQLGLLRRSVVGNSGGMWIWWVKCSESDQPQPQDEPSWRLRDIVKGYSFKLPVSTRYEWSAARKIPKATMRGFLNGYQLTLRERWQVTASPWDAIVGNLNHGPAADRPGNTRPTVHPGRP